MTGIKIYLKYSSKDKLQLPVVPEELNGRRAIKWRLI